MADSIEPNSSQAEPVADEAPTNADEPQNEAAEEPAAAEDDHDKKLREDVSNVINRIAETIDAAPSDSEPPQKSDTEEAEVEEKESDKIESDDKKEAADKKEKDKENNKESDKKEPVEKKDKESNKDSGRIDDSLSAPLASIVSKIQVKDDVDESEAQEEENNKETFSMTEATGAKPLTPENKEEEPEEENTQQEQEQEQQQDEQVEQQEEEKPVSINKKTRRKSTIREEEEIVQYSDEQLAEAYEDFKKKKVLPAFLMRDSVLDFARRQSLQFMVDEDYDAAYRNDLIVNDLLLAYSLDSGGYNADTITRNLEARIEMAQQQRAASNEKYQQRISQLKEREQTKLQQLVDQQEEERKQFEAGCQKQEFLQKFSKPSTKLLQIRKIQKSLALAHKFDEAKEVKAEADSLQRTETIMAQRRAIEFIKMSYAQLLERQQQQLDCATENGKRKIRALEDQLNRENIANRNLTRQLELRLKETKSKKGSCLPPLNSNGSKKAPSKSTMKQLAKYKQTQQVSMLDVKLTNIQKIVGNVRPAPMGKQVKIV